MPAPENVKRMALRCASAYVIVGLALSSTQNVIGLLRGDLTAFAWTGSLVDQARLVWWWFVVPALTWPLDLWWTVSISPMRLVILQADDGVWVQLEGETATEWQALEEAARAGQWTRGPGVVHISRLRALAARLGLLAIVVRA